MKGKIIPDWKVVTDMKGQHASKTTKCVWSVTTAQPQMSYTTAPSQRTHYPALSPCHTMRHYQALSPTARGQQHSKSLLKPAVVVSCCSISRQDCCHHHCTPPSVKRYCFLTGDHHVSSYLQRFWFLLLMPSNPQNISSQCINTVTISPCFCVVA